PVVGSNVGGIKYTVRDGETGYLVPPKDPDRLAERLAHLYQHPKLTALLSRQAIRRANDLFTWEKVARSVAAVYEEVLAAGQTAWPRRRRRRGGAACAVWPFWAATAATCASWPTCRWWCRRPTRRTYRRRRWC